MENPPPNVKRNAPKPKPIPDADIDFLGIITLEARRYGGHARGKNDRRRPDDGIIDTVAVERALRGEIVPLSLREVICAVALGAHQGLGDEEIGERLGIGVRSVCMRRQRYNIPSGLLPQSRAKRRETAA